MRAARFLAPLALRPVAARVSSPLLAPLGASRPRVLAASALQAGSRRHLAADAAPKSIEDGYAQVAGDMTRACKRTTLQFTVPHKPGGLVTALRVLSDAGVNIVALRSRDICQAGDSVASQITIRAEVDGLDTDPALRAAAESLRGCTTYFSILTSTSTPWYPKSLADIDAFSSNALAAGAELVDDPNNPHPGFHDKEYRQRRRDICAQGQAWRPSQGPPPRIDYTEREVKTWGVIFSALQKLFPTHACRAFNQVLPLMIENCGYSAERIPQLADVNQFLLSRTGFSVRPVTGLLSPRDFLNALAYRTFFSTQYIRHHSKPLYTPEPDVCHELLGHVPLFADPDFAAFSQEIGLASLGATDDEVRRLAAVYWFTIEFGLIAEHNGPRAFGAGILSSFGELQYSVTGYGEIPGRRIEKVPGAPLAEGATAPPEYRVFDAAVAAITPYPITRYQPTYFVAESFAKLKHQIITYAGTFSRPFSVAYNPYSRSITAMYTQAAEAF